MGQFVHLHVHSNYSFCRGASTIHELCAAAHRMGMTHLALTDRNGLYGLGWFMETAREFALRPLIGAHLCHEGNECLLLAKNLTGYQYLCQAITRIHTRRELSLIDILRDHDADTFILTHDLALLGQFIRSQNVVNIFAELIPHANREQLHHFARKQGIPLVATNAVYFVDKEDWQLHRLLRAIDLNRSLQRVPPEELADRDAWLTSGADMIARFPDCPDAIANALKIAHECEFDLDFGSFVFPSFPDANGEDIFRFLRNKVVAGIQQRYGQMTAAIQERLDYELDIIGEKGFAAYFLVLADVANKVKLTCGRGSAAASIVSYALGITHVDPIKHNLFFERFLNKGRQDPPDIDIDFAWDERDVVLKYLFDKYGAERTAMISNHSTFKARSAVREIAKVYGLADGEINAVTKKMNSYWQPENIWQMTQTHPIYKETEFSPTWRKIIGLAEKIRGYPRNMSIHCGGVVIAPDRLDHYVPYQPAKKILLLAEGLSDGSGGSLSFNNDGKGVHVVQWEKEQSEEMKLVKMDILGNRSLAVIRDALQAIKDNYDIDIDYATWDPQVDIRTIERFYLGDTMGVFYFESPATRQLLQKVSHGMAFADYVTMDHYQLNVIVTSIIRPASNQYIQEWVKRLHGAHWSHLHPLLKPVLDETLGVMVYQEQMSQAAMHLAGFDPASADMLRKIVSKKHKARQLNDYHSQFVSGARQRGVRDEIIEQVWQMILSFEGYSFCKPHSASYTLVAYKSAWLRAHYPAEFMAAVLSNRGGYYSPFGYISEARRMGLTILMPDINASDIHYVGKGKSVRIGLMQLKGVAQKTVRTVIERRTTDGPFHSLQNFLDRVPVEPADVKILIKAGCFDAVEKNKSRPQLLWQLHLHTARKSARSSSTLELFPENGPSPSTLPAPPQPDMKTILQDELEILGFLASRHPLTLYKERLKNLPFVEARQLNKFVNKRVQTIGWLITAKTVSTKKSELMEFISFEDTTALYETTFFPRAYEQFVHLLSHTRPYILQGRVESNFGALTLTVESVRFL
ncbi:DNA polymerase III subunit alpha [candidate division KSB1 bacterium]|nr:DNA polymerase III subunit alpha [candidate division KSB1 bacterium]